MIEDVKAGWWDAPPGEFWICPECKEKSPVAEWKECEPYCEDCGSHDGRECPRCHAWIDHVWGATAILDAVVDAGQ